jgi:hypothetical protein
MLPTQENMLSSSGKAEFLGTEDLKIETRIRQQKFYSVK